MDQIILTGFMGAGKTTVGEILSELTALPQIDIDSEIIAEQGCPVSEIFEQKGEQGFRDLEHQKLKEVLQKKRLFLPVVELFYDLRIVRCLRVSHL